jgi:catechol 2,3-dioxygenase-like lactoylglutathione lyase family enzyme
MLLGIDHLVIAVRDPDAAAGTMEADLGLAVTGGGRHELGGTFNRLAFLGDTYLELIGLFDASLVRAAAASPVGRAAAAVLDEGREGLATYALASDDIDADVAGRPSIGRPVPGSRRRPDGEVVRWITAFPDLGPDRPPFLIWHEPAGAEWGEAARAARASTRHPAGGSVRLARLTLPVEDLATAVAEYDRVLGLATGPDGIRVGDQRIALVARAAAALEPVVDLATEPGTPSLDVVRFGIRWRRRAA